MSNARWREGLVSFGSGHAGPRRPPHDASPEIRVRARVRVRVRVRGRGRVRVRGRVWPLAEYTHGHAEDDGGVEASTGVRVMTGFTDTAPRLVV